MINQIYNVEAYVKQVEARRSPDSYRDYAPLSASCEIYTSYESMWFQSSTISLKEDLSIISYL